MSEITKLYENAGVEKEVIKGCYEYYSENGGIDIYTVNDCKNKDCNTCKADKSIKEYPPFTAEKQLELIKWLSKLAGKLEISSNYNDTQYLLYFYLNRKTRDEILPNMSTGRSENFEESLAGLINSLWQDLTSEEKQQVKGILE